MINNNTNLNKNKVTKYTHLKYDKKGCKILIFFKIRYYLVNDIK